MIRLASCRAGRCNGIPRNVIKPSDIGGGKGSTPILAIPCPISGSENSKAKPTQSRSVRCINTSISNDESQRIVLWGSAMACAFIHASSEFPYQFKSTRTLSL